MTGLLLQQFQLTSDRLHPGNIALGRAHLHRIFKAANAKLKSKIKELLSQLFFFLYQLFNRERTEIFYISAFLAGAAVECVEVAAHVAEVDRIVGDEG